MQQIPARCRDLRGMTFGRLLVLEFAGVNKNKLALRRCRCECGGDLVTRGNSLTQGLTLSCGCLHREKTITHGKTKTHAFRTWCAMMGRCYSEANNRYSRYGGRGIKVCERWHEFPLFLHDMGEPLPPKHHIERLDNDGNYEPDNCRWATAEEQANNRRTNVMIEYEGRLLTLAQVARALDLKYHVAWSRHRRGTLIG